MLASNFQPRLGLAGPLRVQIRVDERAMCFHQLENEVVLVKKEGIRQGWMGCLAMHQCGAQCQTPFCAKACINGFYYSTCEKIVQNIWLGKQYHGALGFLVRMIPSIPAFANGFIIIQRISIISNTI